MDPASILGLLGHLFGQILEQQQQLEQLKADNDQLRAQRESEQQIAQYRAEVVGQTTQTAPQHEQPAL